jgi:hypothetical protein
MGVLDGETRQADGWMRGAEIGFFCDLQLRPIDVREVRRYAYEAIAFNRARGLKWTIGP